MDSPNPTPLAFKVVDEQGVVVSEIALTHQDKNTGLPVVTVSEIEKALYELARRTCEERNRHAASSLFLLTYLSTVYLTAASREHTEFFRGLAEERCTWPVIYGHHPDVRADADELLKTIGLSKDYDKDPLTPSYRWTPKNAIARQLVAWMLMIHETGEVIPGVNLWAREHLQEVLSLRFHQKNMT